MLVFWFEKQSDGKNAAFVYTEGIFLDYFGDHQMIKRGKNGQDTQQHHYIIKSGLWGLVATGAVSHPGL